MRNIRIALAYDGTNYHGFQRQPEEHGPTIQGQVEKAWNKLFSESINVITAGRTDTGVHAAGQVINFSSEARIPAANIPRALNTMLPGDIRILDAEDISAEFNARKSAKWKRYDYRIDNHTIPNVFTRLYYLHEPVYLDISLMQKAARDIEGTHNFKSFAAAGGSSSVFIRNLFHCQVKGRGKMIEITCIGDGFLYNMVRIIAGTLLYVGKGKFIPEDVSRIIEAKDRTQAGETAPAAGLTLTYVDYEGNIPSRVFDDIEANEHELLFKSNNN